MQRHTINTVKFAISAVVVSGSCCCRRLGFELRWEAMSSGERRAVRAVHCRPFQMLALTKAFDEALDTAVSGLIEEWFDSFLQTFASRFRPCATDRFGASAFQYLPDKRQRADSRRPRSLSAVAPFSG